ncbi:S8 family peptidase [Fulvivirgaceae bacterium PWU4]|uniref:S8 family peptidase n=1 Tax=Chryseosolibacter histidini TaxID=2782349 RepID=A0AAP2DPF5_9BACT|nr:S8 family peptidase [Chryseosolibacter histidini]MBT1700098.1 S8 family peptidase [Chryseosolibacter histidini]
MACGKRFGVLAGLILLSFTCLSQANRYMVFFKDKTGTPFSESEPSAFLSQKAIDRRIRQGIDVLPQDLPVNAAYVTGVKNTGASVFFKTRWMNGVLVQCDPSLLPAIQALPFVDHVEFVAPQPRLVSNGRRALTLRKKANAGGIETQTQLQMLGIPDMHSQNFRGEGMTIAIFDGGFSGVDVAAPFHDVIADKRIDLKLSHNFVYNTKDIFQYDDHGTQVFSIIAASIPDVFTGGAPEASYQLYITEDVRTEYRIEEYNWLFAAERADSAGVDIINSSLGYYDFDQASMNYTTAQMDGKTTVVTRAAQWAADRGIVVVCSAGNEGNIPSWRIISAPADAVDVIAVANVNAQGIVSSSSSIGPSSDGRIKPDLAALGTAVRTISPSGTVTTASGTSLSAPLITSLVAGLWQRFPDFTNKELIDVMKKSATRAANPDFQAGYGIPNYKAVVNYIGRTQHDSVLEVFPNPAADTLKIRSLNPEEVSSCVYEVVSAQGQVMMKGTATFTWLAPDYPANVSNLSAGIYFLRVWIGEQRYTFKVVKV